MPAGTRRAALRGLLAVLASSLLLTVAAPADAGTAPAADSGVPLTTRAKAAGIPVLSREAFATHTHTGVLLVVDGETLTIPAGIGIDEAAGKIAAVHTHDTTGIVHVESPEATDHYTLAQFLTLWGVGGTKRSVCSALVDSPTCRLSVRSKERGTTTLKVRLDDGDVVALIVDAPAK